VFIEPGSPWENAYVESFNGKICDELLAIEEFITLLEAKIMAEDFRQCKHSAIGQIAPVTFEMQYSLQSATIQHVA